VLVVQRQHGVLTGGQRGVDDLRDLIGRLCALQHQLPGGLLDADLHFHVVIPSLVDS
jgi:hypothetical protein